MPGSFDDFKCGRHFLLLKTLEKLNAYYTFTNTSKSTITITKTQASCGCTVPSLEKDTSKKTRETCYLTSPDDTDNHLRAFPIYAWIR